MPESIKKTLERAKKNQPKNEDIYFEDEGTLNNQHQFNQGPSIPNPNDFHIEDLDWSLVHYQFIMLSK